MSISVTGVCQAERYRCLCDRFVFQIGISGEFEARLPAAAAVRKANAVVRRGTTSTEVRLIGRVYTYLYTLTSHVCVVIISISVWSSHMLSSPYLMGCTMIMLTPLVFTRSCSSWIDTSDTNSASGCKSSTPASCLSVVLFAMISACRVHSH